MTVLLTDRPSARLAPVDLARWLAERCTVDPDPADLGVPRVPFGGADTARTGRGVRVALLDGVVDVGHPDLRGARLSDLSSRSAGAPSPLATAHASLLVGQGVRDVRGLVPDARLLVAPVLTPGGFTSDELLVRAVRRVVAEGAQVLVLPFGRRRLGRRVAMVLRGVTERGVRVVVAAGDLGPDVLAFPASVAGVVAVTAHDGDGVLATCSARADLSAPGRDVPASGPAGRLLLEGSSAAAVLAAGAHVAGVDRDGERREAREGHRLVEP